MTKVNSTDAPHARKPKKTKPPTKPRKDFPLFASGNGQWCRKVAGKLRYFGSWRTDPRGVKALERWINEKDDLEAGRVPRARTAGESPTLEDLVNAFLMTKAVMRDGGELAPHTWNSYADICDELIEAFGKDRLLTDLRPADFEKLRAAWAERWGPVTLANEMNRARVVFNYAYENEMVKDEIRFGAGFRRPSQKTLRLDRASKGVRAFTADELRAMIAKATQPLSTMILLGINAGLGNADVARLPVSALDLDRGWLTYPRPKTGIMRRCPLWPETVQAIREWLTLRPTPKDADNFGLCFITKRGNPWDAGTDNRAISHEMRKLLDELGIGGNRNFYALRHSTETIGGESRDQVAVDAIMGHVDPSMAAAYREGISDERLRTVTELVRAWLFAPAKEQPLRIAAVGQCDVSA